MVWQYLRPRAESEVVCCCEDVNAVWHIALPAHTLLICS